MGYHLPNNFRFALYVSKFSPPFQAEMYQHQQFGALAPPNSLIFFIFFKAEVDILRNNRMEKLQSQVFFADYLIFSGTLSGGVAFCNSWHMLRSIYFIKKSSKKSILI